MSDHEDAIRDLLAADATVAALATGGVYSFRDLSVQGFDRNLYPSAYDNAGFALPRIVVHARGQRPGGGLADPVNGYASTQQVVEIYCYDDASAGFATIETLRDRCYTLLQGQRIPGAAFRATWMMDIRTHDPNLNNAPLLRSDYEVIGYRQS